MMARCSACNWPNRDDALYCAHCGTRLTSADADNPTTNDQAGDIAPADGTPTVPLLLPSEPSAVNPLPVGSLLQRRFQIVELLEEQADCCRYRAIDLQRCGVCGAAIAADGEDYCPHCGASRATPCFVELTAQWRREPPEHDEHLAIGERDYYIRVESSRHPTSGGTGWSRLHIGMRTDPGSQRELNQDAIDARVYERTGHRRVALLAVADGLGGHASGEVASQVALEALWTAIHGSIWSAATRHEEPLPDPQEALRQAFAAADRAVAEMRASQGNDMSTTLVAALLIDDALLLANAGDSRAYLLTPGGLVRVTHDHSLVQRLVDAGKIQPSEVYTHPQRNVIFNSLGEAAGVAADLCERNLEPDQRLLLCSDGLWEMVRDDGIEEVLLAEPDAQRACDLLVQRAIVAGGEDNISVIIAQLQAPVPTE